MKWPINLNFSMPRRLAQGQGLPLPRGRRLKIINEWLPDVAALGIYFLWPGAWSKQSGRWLTMTRLFVTQPLGGWSKTWIVRITPGHGFDGRIRMWDEKKPSRRCE